MTQKEINPVMLEWLYARELMRRLGFTPEELFIQVQQAYGIDNKTNIFLVIRAQDKEFTWATGAIDMGQSAAIDHFNNACELWNAPTGRDWKDGGFLRSRSYESRTELLSALHAKGFVTSQTGWN